MGSIKRFLETGIINTLRFNFKYFGLGGVFHPRALLAKNVYIRTLKGNVTVEGNKAHLGYNISGIADKKYERAIWDNTGTVRFGSGVFLGSGTRISNVGVIVLGEKFFVSANTSFVCSKEITVGKNSTISWECLVMDTDFHSIYYVANNEHRKKNEDAEIHIGNHVWIGCRTSIMKGATIPNGAIIASDSKVSKKLETENAIYANNQVIRTKIYWK